MGDKSCSKNLLPSASMSSAIKINNIDPLLIFAPVEISKANDKDLKNLLQRVCPISISSGWRIRKKKVFMAPSSPGKSWCQTVQCDWWWLHLTLREKDYRLNFFRCNEPIWDLRKEILWWMLHSPYSFSMKTK